MLEPTNYETDYSCCNPLNPEQSNIKVPTKSNNGKILESHF